MARIVVDNLEGILDPDVVPVTMPKAVCDGPSSPFDQGKHLIENAGGVVRMEMIGPALRIRRHLLRRVPHDFAKVLGDECTGVIP
jgi:hypothetical protein